MKRVPMTVAVLTSAALLPVQAAYASPSTEAAAAVALSPVSATSKNGLPKACAKRLASPRKKVAGKTFARCVLKAQKKARTVVIRTAYDDGTWGKGPYRFGATTDARVTQNDGGGLVALGKKFWIKHPGGDWVKAVRNSSDPEANLAWVSGQLWRANSSPESYRRVLGSSKAWKPTGKAKKINGVKARQYAGSPKLPGGTVEDYKVWLDAKYRPVRVTSTVSAYGQQVKMTQDFTRWGKKVSIKAPAGR